MPGNQSTADSKPAQRALYTRDGYRLKRPDGSDDLALLPGFTDDIADKLRSNSVNEFEQVALWTQREISHFADRLGINATTAGALPNAAKEILAGKFRVDSHREVEKN
jgi:predicted flap endonuclease-1-like 5' DNA nuclease